jgi:hypothetical protein
MSEVINPPDYYFTGINFNPAFYAQVSGIGLSEATANTLYLRKTVPDTATAQETFSSGIITSSIRTPLVGSSLIIGDTLTTGNVDIGSIFAQTFLRGTVNADTIVGLATTGTQCISTLRVNCYIECKRFRY